MRCPFCVYILNLFLTPFTVMSGGDLFFLIYCQPWVVYIKVSN